MSRFTDALTAQIANELAASQQYVAIAVWYDGETLPQLAGPASNLLLVEAYPAPHAAGGAL